MKLYKLLLGLVILIILSVNINAVDYNNISFTNQEFFNTSVFATKTVQINDTHIAVGFLGQGTLYSQQLQFKTCLIDGTSCSSAHELGIGDNTGASFDMFSDGTDLIFAIGRYGSHSSAYYYKMQYDGTQVYGLKLFNTGDTNYVSAAQTNSTHFAITFQDTAASSNAKIIICKLDGTSCGTETTIRTGINTYLKMIKNSGNILNILTVEANLLVHYEYNITGTQISGAKLINVAATSFVDMIEGSDNKLKIVYRDDGNSFFGTFRSCNLDGSSCGSEIVYNSRLTSYNTLVETNNLLFVAYDDISHPTSRRGIVKNFNLTGGSISSENTFSLSISSYESMIVNSNNELVISYGDATSSKGMFAISEPLIAGATVTINQPIAGQYLDNLNFNLNVSTDLNTNLTYSLNGASNITLGTDINSSVSTITGIEGNNTIIVYSNYTGSITSDSVTFTIDTIDPSLNVSIPTEYNSYTGFNISKYINVSDTNLDTCIVTISGESSTTCTNTSYTFTTNGNKTINITATDLAGNTATSLNNVMLINPINYFYFQDSALNPVTNFTFNGIFYTDYATIKHYDLGLGTHSLIFQKVGYFTQSFNVTFNNTNELNNTYSLTTASINVQIRDKRTLAIIPTELFNIELIGSIGVETNTTTGYKNISNIFFESGEYRLVVSSSNYFAEDVFFEFTNEEVIDVVVYMNANNESNAGVVVISVVDGLGQALPGAIVQALQWDGATSQFLRVSEGQTGLDGKITLNIILEDKVYIFRATKLGNTADSPQIRLLATESGKIITIPLGSAVGERTYLFRNLITHITELSYVGNTTTIEFEWVDQNGISQTICLNTYRYIGLSEVLLNTSCTSGVSGTYTQAFVLNTSHNINIKGEVKIGNAYYTMKTFNYPSTGSLPSIITFLNFEFVVIPLLFLLAIALGIISETLQLGAFLLFLASGMSLYLVPTLINAGIVIFLYAFSMLIIWGATKK